MSSDAQDQRTLDAMRQLPSRGEGGDERRGYVGWGPDEDATCGQGKTVEHADWPAYLAAMANTDRYVIDFYFGHGHTSDPCECCDESGRTKEYAELDRSFYRHGGGRWAGWGKGRLTHDEVDALMSEGRIGRGKGGVEITPDNIDEHLGPWGHDSINQWILVAARAKRMGFDRVCNECYGEGRLKTGPETISLDVWTADPVRGHTRVDHVAGVRVDELAEVREHMEALGLDPMRERFGWATGSNMHPDMRFEARETGWGAGRGALGMGAARPWWGDGISYASWGDFVSEFGYQADDMNLAVDWHFVVDPEFAAERGEVPKGDHMRLDDQGLPPEFGIDIWMTHPRKGADRAIRIRYATVDQTDEIRAYLKSAADIHERHFGWASGNYPKPAVEDEDEETAEPAPLW